MHFQMRVSPSLSTPALVAGYMAADISSRPDHQRIGPFMVGLSSHTAHPAYNYAVPIPDAAPTRAEIGDLLALFARHHRTPRLEYVSGSAEQAEAALLTAGFTLDQRLPMLACRPGAAIPLPTPMGITISTVSEPRDLFDALSVQNDAYGEAEPVSVQDVQRLQSLIGRGGYVALARDAITHRPCGTGLVTEPIAGVAEVAAVGTLTSHRGRGIASALCSRLAKAAHHVGATTVFLDVEGPAEEAVYLRAGFTRAGERTWISRR
ncbi:GNAT family N-acetyltransferase [Humibacter ginsenosidimutans]|uniref:GNAT family N-acetyltransferase n=1 Tax=Humibacter ginsenosidimutans TaxID=2599293 RepID=UPI001AEFC868|nr:GNAT family N-acetyltransferase [Humibacter ginsenosidimutans]